MGFESTPFVLPPFAFEPAVAPPPPVFPEAPGEVGMSTRAVRLQLAAIVVGTNPAGTDFGLPGRFRHVPELADADLPGQGRDFYLVWDDLGTDGPYTPLGASNRRIDSLRLVVVYPDAHDDAKIEDLMGDDYDRISARLLDPVLWDQPTSTILNLSRDETAYVPARFTRASRRRLMTFPLRVEHTR